MKNSHSMKPLRHLKAYLIKGQIENDTVYIQAGEHPADKDKA